MVPLDQLLTRSDALAITFGGVACAGADALAEPGAAAMKLPPARNSSTAFSRNTTRSLPNADRPRTTSSTNNHWLSRWGSYLEDLQAEDSMPFC